MITETELREILRHWNIPQELPIRNVKVMDGAKTAENVWQVGKDYFLKTGDWAALLRNARIAKVLAAQGFAASTPLPTRDGDEITETQGAFVLMRRVDGRPLSRKERLGADCAGYGFQYGQGIARLHQALRAVEADIHPYEQNLFAAVNECALPNIRRQNIELKDSFFDEYIHNFGALFEKLPKHLIHRDPHPGNILFRGGEVCGFVDFDLSERNIRLWDPCYCATGILAEHWAAENAYKQFSALLSAILHGYDSVSPLTAAEKRAIYGVLCSIQMICAAYFESNPAYKGLARFNREMLLFIAGQKEQINRIF